jgi:hypothetical protein
MEDVGEHHMKMQISSMKHLLIAFLLFNALLTTLWACGSGPKPAHYGVFQTPKTTGPVSTNSVAITTNKGHP